MSALLQRDGADMRLFDGNAASGRPLQAAAVRSRGMPGMPLPPSLLLPNGRLVRMHKHGGKT